jgi:predicted amidohydrolase
MQRDLSIALVQMNSTPDVEANLRAIERAIASAAHAGARLVLLPENAPFLGSAEQRVATSEPLDGPQVHRVREAAVRHGVWVQLGSFAERSEDPERTWNTSVLVDPAGEVRATYRKIHLFDVNVAADTAFKESDTTLAGPVVPCLVDVEGWSLGMSICYDLRFPELYRSLSAAGVDLITVPAAFTWRTGAAGHWEVLLRARAIENQCWVAAPAQCGTCIPGRTSWGHSVVVDPWGRVRMCAGEDPVVEVVRLSAKELRAARQKIPALTHRRAGWV